MKINLKKKFIDYKLFIFFQVESVVKRPYNPKLSRVFEARKHRIAPQILKRPSDLPMELANVELYLNGIMQDIDTILEEWNNNPNRGSNSYPISESMDDRPADRQTWIPEILGIKFNLQNLY